MNKIKDLTGKTFGKLVILSIGKEPENFEGQYTQKWWKCKCSCGKIKTINGHSLTQKMGATKSCGCLRFKRNV